MKSHSYWSLYQLFKKCQYSYHLGYELRKRGAPPDSKYLTAMLRGAVFHTLMEWKTKGGLTWKETINLRRKVVEYTAVKMQKEVVISTRRRNLVMAQLTEALKTTLHSEHISLLDSVQQAEKTLKREIDGMLFKGRTDGWGIYDEKSFYIDYKLQMVGSPAGKQLVFYHILEPVEEIWTLFPMSGRAVKSRLSPKRVEQVKEEMVRLAKLVEQGRREPNLNACSWCLFKGVCDEYVKPTRTRHLSR